MYIIENHFLIYVPTSMHMHVCIFMRKAYLSYLCVHECDVCEREKPLSHVCFYMNACACMYVYAKSLFTISVRAWMWCMWARKVIFPCMFLHQCVSMRVHVCMCMRKAYLSYLCVHGCDVCTAYVWDQLFLIPVLKYMCTFIFDIRIHTYIHVKRYLGSVHVCGWMCIDAFICMSVCMCLCVCVVFMYICLSASLSVRVAFICMYAYASLVSLSLSLSLSLFMRVSICDCIVCVCVCVCMYVCSCVCVFILRICVFVYFHAYICVLLCVCVCVFFFEYYNYLWVPMDFFAWAFMHAWLHWFLSLLSLCMRVCISIFFYLYACVFALISIFTSVFKPVTVCARARVCVMFGCVCYHDSVCVLHHGYVYIPVCVCICMYAHSRNNIYIQTNTH
jgi:hypothetical protein